MNDHNLHHELRRIADLLEQYLGNPPPVDWNAHAYCWVQRSQSQGYLQSIPDYAQIHLEDLQHIEAQKSIICTNTEQFLAGLPANNVLLTGARGTGKSSLVRAQLTTYAHQGLRMVEVDRQHLTALPSILAQLHQRPERFIIFCDDLAFSEGDDSYRALKVVLDGSLHAASHHVLIYATSNRRHLMPEYMRDNTNSQHVQGELRPSENIEEKVSLSDRFGLWLSFYPQDQEAYLASAQHWLTQLGGHWNDEARHEALLFALNRSSRSGRSAWQFACDYSGRTALKSRPS